MAISKRSRWTVVAFGLGTVLAGASLGCAPGGREASVAAGRRPAGVATTNPRSQGLVEPAGSASEARIPVVVEELHPSTAAVHGRVEDLRTGAGLAGVRVVALHGEERWETLSASDGSFALELSLELEQVSLTAGDLPQGWRVLPGSEARPFEEARALRAEELRGQRAVPLVVAERLVGAVEGQTVDAVSGEPLAGVGLCIVPSSEAGSSNAGTIQVTSDAEGRFRLEQLPGGLVCVSAAAGGPAPTRSWFHLVHAAPGPTSWRIPIESSLRFELELTGELPPDPSELAFLVVQRGGDSYPSRAPLRPAGGPHRYTVTLAPQDELRPDEPVTLAVADRAGHYLATLPWSWGAALPRAPLRFALQRTASMEYAIDEPGWSRGHDGFDPDGFTRVELELCSLPADLPGAAWRRQWLRWLPPGVQRVRILSRAWHDQVQDAVLLPGETTTLVVTPRPLEGGRTVHGMVRTQSGEFPRNISVEVCLARDPARCWEASSSPGCMGFSDHGIRWDPERGVGTFVFEGVPPGGLRVQASGFRVLTQVEQRQEAGGDVLVDVLVLDRGRPDGFGFLLTLPDGAEPNYLGVATRALDGGPELASLGALGGVVGLGDPRQRRFEWAVEGEGLVPVYGTQDDFRLARGRDRFCPVEMEAGWGTRVLVVDGEGKALVGARVLVDGEETGTTDQDGMLELRGKEPPLEIQASLPGWRERSRRDARPPWARWCGWWKIELSCTHGARSGCSFP